MKERWDALSAGGRAGLVAGVLLILLLVGALGKWSLHREQAVLFAELNQQDAAAMVTELERLKQPYELAEQGTAILVPAESAAKTRLKMVEKNLPAHGGVGFEIFNDTDYGMTEFAQKVNYLRALQGELTRTILALEEIQSARVHLVLPEGGLFKRPESRAKASVTVALKPGRTLGKEQIGGIQRLVAASVPEMEHKDVTVLSSTGAPLSGTATQQSAESGDWKLEAKRQVEAYLTAKLMALIDKAVGAGRGAVTVDAELDLDNVKVTEEEVLPGSGDERASGVLVRERSSTRAAAGASAPAEAGGTATTTNTDAEYAVGRKVQQVVSTPGSVKRITVGVILPTDVDAARVERLRDLIGAAVGFDKDRGDVVALYAVPSASGEAAGAASALPSASQAAASVAVAGEGAGEGMSIAPQAARAPGRVDALLPALALALGALALLAIGRYAWRRSASASPAARQPAAHAPLTDAQREKLLGELRGWLSGATTT